MGGWNEGCARRGWDITCGLVGLRAGLRFPSFSPPFVVPYEQSSFQYTTSSIPLPHAPVFPFLSTCKYQARLSCPYIGPMQSMHCERYPVPTQIPHIVYTVSWLSFYLVSWQLAQSSDKISYAEQPRRPDDPTAKSRINRRSDRVVFVSFDLDKAVSPVPCHTTAYKMHPRDMREVVMHSTSSHPHIFTSLNIDSYQSRNDHDEV